MPLPSTNILVTAMLYRANNGREERVSVMSGESRLSRGSLEEWKTREESKISTVKELERERKESFCG